MNPKKTDEQQDELPDLTSEYIEFARLIAEGKKQAEAYRLAISPNCQPNTSWVEGSKIANNPDVRLWIDAFRREVFSKETYTIEKYLSECAEFRDEARREGNKGAGFQYQQLIGKVVGYAVERTEDMTPRTKDETLEERLQSLTENKQPGKHLH